MAKRKYYRERLYKRLVNTTAEYVEGEPVRQGMTFWCVCAGLEDEDNAPTSIKFGYKVGERFIVLEDESNPSAGVTYHTERPHIFISGDIPQFEVKGGTSGDDLRGYLEGYYEEV